MFDQGLGDLFVIRVAGNIVAPSQVGSVEFAAARFGTRLVVVLGHSQCGAILATLEELQRPTDNQSRNLRSIVDRVRPSVEGLLATDLRHDADALVQQAVRANIRASANHLRHGSEVLEQLIRDDGLLVVGAEYSLETGRRRVLRPAGLAVDLGLAGKRALVTGSTAGIGFADRGGAGARGRARSSSTAAPRGACEAAVDAAAGGGARRASATASPRTWAPPRAAPR